MTAEAVEIRLLGGVAILAPGRGRIRIASAKGLALLAYLLQAAPRLQARDLLADMLWPEHQRDQARANLRQTLARLRPRCRTTRC